ncbi:Metallo-dependent phosphatase-like protein [Pyronema domesticum]|uniref:Endopolyphosphatase n=1 Tax=Pyronema omphalodes (strain CBS 100304) TaxID=1076935 RepID=U4L6W7_PYROM|nr:Metallo-dependent phosphatase-like protein [Pyronema domesticum]CCX12225.1 Similar to Endopolyphosphatase; acc. no. Q9P3S1 [Pyronema omphalodes CBS 100304]
MLFSSIVTILSAATAVSASVVPEQKPLRLIPVNRQSDSFERTPKKLHGRFLHITDFHPDGHYKVGSDADITCHRGEGNAGYYGLEKSNCDTPISLVNETFKWIEENLRDHIDFVIWTGDSARHDNDVKIPRTPTEIYALNEMLVSKMVSTFGRSNATGSETNVPVVPTIGNNDIFPHNIMLPGPSKLTKEYVELWKEFIPEDQYHIFHKGAYFSQQVVPGKNGKVGAGSDGGLVVISLNTIYFYDANKAVDGCDVKGSPGYDQMEWLNVQLSLMRDRNQKAILIGHVPPTWTSEKMNWDESCWKKYVLWSRQYRDLIVGHLYGHMNLDHFVLLDSNELKPPHLKNPKKGKKHKKGRKKKGRKGGKGKSAMPGFSRISSDVCEINEYDPEEDPIITINSAESYLHSLREAFEQMLIPDKKSESDTNKNHVDKWSERYVMAHVGPSVVPNYFPTMRVVEYNTTGLVDGAGMMVFDPHSESAPPPVKPPKKRPDDGSVVPEPPSKSSPPGPAYSVQAFTMMSYKQYFANLTKANEIHEHNLIMEARGELRKRDNTAQVQYEIEYDTAHDDVYKLQDLTVGSYVDLARRMVDARNNDKDHKSTVVATEEETDIVNTADLEDDIDITDDNVVDADKKKKKKQKKKKKGNKARDKVWHAFIKRAFIGTIDDDDVYNFEAVKVQQEELGC